MTWRRLKPDELDHESLWLCVSLCALGFAWLWLRLDLPRPACLFRELTHWPCPTCGATRSLGYMLEGALGAALRLNPLIGIAFLGCLGLNLYAAVVTIGRFPRLRIEHLSSRAAWTLRGLIALALAANWLWLIRTGV